MIIVKKWKDIKVQILEYVSFINDCKCKGKNAIKF